MVAIGPGGSYSQQSSQSFGSNVSNSFIPDYSQTPILENIAQYAEGMAPQVYEWGMNAYNQNQGNINSMLQQAQTYASPERIQAEMGMAEAGVQQAGEAARQSSISDLQSYGIDPSSGRYAALDQANRVQTAAAAAGAGNQQRMATQAAGNALLQQGISASMQNEQIGYGAAGAANALLGTGMQLKYSPLGTSSTGSQESTSQGTSQSAGQGYGAGSGGYWMRQAGSPAGGPGVAKGGFISPDLSPTDGEDVDDIPARLNAGEYVIPKDVVKWKGKEFFSKLIAQSRKQRATNGSSKPEQSQGYARGGAITHRQSPFSAPDIGQGELSSAIHSGMSAFAPTGFQDGGDVQPQQSFIPQAGVFSYAPTTGPGSFPTVPPQEIPTTPEGLNWPQPIQPTRPQQFNQPRKEREA